MSKNEAKTLAAYYGCKVAYSGHRRTMFVKGDNSLDAVVAIKAKNPQFEVVAS